MLEDKDTLPTFGGGNRSKLAPGIIPGEAVAPSVGSSRKMPSRCGPPGSGTLSSLDARIGGEAVLVLWAGCHEETEEAGHHEEMEEAGRHEEMEGGRHAVVE